MLSYTISKNLKSVEIKHRCPSMDLLPEIVVRLIDAIIIEDEINISSKKANLSNEEKTKIISSMRREILELAKAVPVTTNIDIKIDDGVYETGV